MSTQTLTEFALFVSEDSEPLSDSASTPSSADMRLAWLRISNLRADTTVSTTLNEALAAVLERLEDEGTSYALFSQSCKIHVGCDTHFVLIPYTTGLMARGVDCSPLLALLPAEVAELSEV